MNISKEKSDAVEKAARSMIALGIEPFELTICMMVYGAPNSEKRKAFMKYMQETDEIYLISLADDKEMN